MKRIFKTIGFIFLGLFSFLALYFLAAFCLGRLGVAGAQNQKKEMSIYLLTNGVHTDLVFPVRNKMIDWSKKIKFEHTKGKQSHYQYIAIGWGDKGFYLDTPTWAELKVSTAFKAAFGLSTSAIHATYYRTIQENDNCIKIDISEEQYQHLIDFITKDFIKKADGSYVNIITDAVYGNSDAFYDAKGSYHLFRTCNTWTNEALKAAGLKASVWTPFDTGIFYQYQRS